MSRSSEPGERAQQSVAELLARYGETAPSTTGRRRRRESGAGETAPHSIIQRVQTDSGPLPATGRAARRRAAEAESGGYGDGYGSRQDNGYAGGYGDSSGYGNGSGYGSDSGYGNGHGGSNGYSPSGTSANGFSPNGLNDPNGPNGFASNGSYGSNGSSPGTGSPEKPEWSNYSWSNFTGPTGGGRDPNRWDDQAGGQGDRNGWTAAGPNGWADHGSGTSNGNGLAGLTTRGPGPAAVEGRADLDARTPGGPSRARNAPDEGTWSGARPPTARQEPFVAAPPSDGPSTEQMPRFDPRRASGAVHPAPTAEPPVAPPPPPAAFQQAVPEPPTQAWQHPPGAPPLPTPAPTESMPAPPPALGRSAPAGGPPAGLGPSTVAIPSQDQGEADPNATMADLGEPVVDYEAADYDAIDYDAHYDLGDLAEEDEDAEYRSPIREWAVMATQIGVGVIGGAGLWLICEWLWQRIPVVALVVALAVITGLVWVVRRVRRAEDLQTTVIAVLVGLFVTVSPAALLLVGR